MCVRADLLNTRLLVPLSCERMSVVVSASVSQSTCLDKWHSTYCLGRVNSKSSVPDVELEDYEYYDITASLLTSWNVDLSNNTFQYILKKQNILV